MLLEIENKKPVHVDMFQLVEKALRRLKSYGPSSFACLSDADGAYVQIAGGRVTCVVERRMPSGGRHFRAYLASARVPFEGTQTLSFGAGQLNMEPDEILFIDDVIPVFEAFFNSEPLPSNIYWRDMSDYFSEPTVST